MRPSEADSGRAVSLRARLIPDSWLASGGAMKRDMDIIRAIMLQIEQDLGLHYVDYNSDFGGKDLTVEGASDEQVYGHLLMLLDSPFLEGERFMSGEVRISKITWEGHEFLDSIRDQRVWNKIKAGAEKMGGVGLGFVWQMGKAIITAEIKTRLGLDVQ